MAEKRSRSIWRVHEATARGLCQLTFVLLGILPLAVCLFWCFQQFLPTYQSQQVRVWEQLLSSKLGMRVKVAAFEAQAPQRFALHEIRLTHPETGEPFGDIRLVEVRWAAGKWNIQLTKPRLNGDKAELACRIVHDWLLCRPQAASVAAVVDMDELSIYDLRREQSLHQVSLKLTPGTEVTKAKLTFYSQPQPARAPSASPMELDVKRHHRQSELGTTMVLNTGTLTLPCSLAGNFIPGLARLGESAQFSGMVTIDVLEQAWQVKLSMGKFRSIDMSRLTGGSALAVSGNGEIHFEKLEFNEHGLELAHGRAVISSGKLPHSLLQAIGKHLGVQMRATNPVNSYAFDMLDFSIHLSESKLHWWGVMSDALGPLALREQEKWVEALPLDRIVSVLNEGTHWNNASEPAEMAAGLPAAGLPVSWLAKRALVWLPLGKEQAAATAATLRLSSNQAPSGNE